MKNLFFLTIILLLSGLVIHGCGGSEDTAKSDQELIQGVWAGNAVGIETEFTMTISGNNFNMETTDSEVFYKGTFVLNEKVTPKQADFKMDDCNIEEYIGTTARAIYKIENDTLTIASNEPGNEIRPTVFEGSDQTQVFTLKKQ